MAKKKHNKLSKWILIPVVVFALTAILVLFKNNLPQSRQSSTGYQVYQDSTYGFSIEYPGAWEIRKDTQVFENGDAVAVGISGPTQKENTELTDGAQVVVSQPFSIDTDLATWARKYFGNQAELLQNSINGRLFEKVYDCSNLGCMTYYYTLINDQIYGVAAFAESQNADKAVYENAIVYMLKSLKFTNAENRSISKEEAVAKVKALPEVIEYLKRVPQGLIAVNGEEDDSYLIQVYEVKNGHTATFNWFNVDKKTGEIKRQF